MQLTYWPAMSSPSVASIPSHRLPSLTYSLPVARVAASQDCGPHREVCMLYDADLRSCTLSRVLIMLLSVHSTLELGVIFLVQMFFV